MNSFRLLDCHWSEDDASTPLSPPLKRGISSFILVGSVMVIGTVGIHHLEGLSYIDSFYFMSMIATAQGPAVAPVTTGGKVFTSIIAFLSVGAVVAALGFIFGPFFGKLWKVGVEKMEDEMRRLTHPGGKD
jgi:hypothetical protein